MVKRFLLKILLGKDFDVMTELLFTQRVILGKTSFDDVPNGLKQSVANELINSGLIDLVTIDKYKKAINK